MELNFASKHALQTDTVTKSKLKYALRNRNNFLLQRNLQCKTDIVTFDKERYTSKQNMHYNQLHFALKN